MCVIYAQNFHLTPWKKYTASKWRTVFPPLILIFLLPCFDITDKKGCLFSYIGTPQIFTLDSPDWSQLVHCHQRIVRWASCQIIVHFRWRYKLCLPYLLFTYGFSKSSTKTSGDSAECVNNNETKTDTKFIFDFGQ